MTAEEAAALTYQLDEIVRRFERAADTVSDGASRMEEAARSMGSAATRNSEAAGTMYSAAGRMGG